MIRSSRSSIGTSQNGILSDISVTVIVGASGAGTAYMLCGHRATTLWECQEGFLSKPISNNNANHTHCPFFIIFWKIQEKNGKAGCKKNDCDDYLHQDFCFLPKIIHCQKPILMWTWLHGYGFRKIVGLHAVSTAIRFHQNILHLARFYIFFLDMNPT